MHKLFVSCVLAVTVTLAAQSPLTTTFGNNNAGGVGGAIYFDMTAAIALNITGIDVNLNSAATTAGSVDIYTCVGSYLGNEANPGAWTMIGTGTVTAAGAGTPSTLALASPILITPGTAGYAYVGVGHGFAYTNGTGANQTYSTTELTLNAGAAVNLAFTGTPFTPRVVNTTITYVPGAGNFAQKTLFGTGCNSAAGTSFYENFAAGTFDLVSPVDNMTLLHTGNGYLALSGLTTYVAPPATATTLALTDDSQTTVTLSSPLRVGATGSTSSLTVCSNGFVSTGSNGTGFTPTVATMLNNANAGWYSWHDYNPAAGGAVKFHEAGGISYVTWDGVFSFGQTTPETLQFQFDRATGNVAIVWVSISNLGNGHLVGFSEGGPSADPGSIDLSALLPATIPNAALFDIAPLAFNGDARPVIGTPVNMTVRNIPTGAPIAAVIYGLTKFNPGIDLTGIGMPGCFQYCTQDAVALILGPGNTATNVFSSPNNPALSGVIVIAQGAVYNPNGGHNALGALSSNGVELLLDIN